MEKDRVISDKRILAGNIAVMAALFIMTFGCWNEYSWYEKIAPLGTLICCLLLGITFLCYADIKKCIRDLEFYLMLAGDAVALVHLLVIKSNKGAFLTVALLLLVLYLSDKLVIPVKLMYGAGIYLGFFFYYWTFDVKGYFKGYNTNYGGLVLITGFVFAVLMLRILSAGLRNAEKKKISIAVMLFTIFMFAWGYNIIAWYRARCALVGLLVFGVLLLIPRKVWGNKILFGIIIAGSTFGAIAVSGLYILLGKMKEVFTIQIFYKDILSGRDEIWTELWTEFLHKPITGIGSSYVMKLSWMDGMLEVHNGLLDILIVHGITVFIIVCYFLIKRLWALRENVATDEISRTAFCGITAMLISSFLENFFIVPPFTICFLILLVWARKSSIRA